MPDNARPPDANSRPQHLFLVRIWHEPSRLSPDRWRGSVEHVPSRQRLYFASFGDLNDFITLRLNGRSPDQANGESNG